MATKTFEELKQMAIQIRDEKTNKQNTATRIGTQMLEHLNKLEQEYYNKENIDEQKNQTDLKLSNLQLNTGVSSYPTFSQDELYPVGQIINYDDRLYEFTVEHAPGAWDNSHVKPSSVKNDTDRKFSELSRENGVVSSKIGLPISFEYGGIDTYGNFLENKIRIRSSAIYSKTAGTNKIQFDYPSTLIFRAGYAFKGNIFVKTLSAPISDNILSFTNDGTFDNVRFTFIKADEEDISEEELKATRAYNLVSIENDIEKVGALDAFINVGVINAEWIEGYFVSRDDGNLVSHNTAFYIDFIEINKRYLGVGVKNNSAVNVCFYNADTSTFIKGIQITQNKAFDLSEFGGVVKVRFSAFHPNNIGLYDSDLGYPIADKVQTLDDKVQSIEADTTKKIRFEYGGIMSTDGSLPNNNIRVRSLPIYFYGSGFVKFRFNTPSTLIGVLVYAYNGSTPIKMISGFSTANNYISFNSDGTFDNVRISFKKPDESEISEEDLLECYAVSNDLVTITEESNIFEGLKYAALGDSITYGFIPRNYPGYPGQLDSYAKLAAAKLGMNFVNYGISGSTIANVSGRNPMSVRYADMVDDADIITVMGGTNDVRNGVQLGTMEDRTNDTFYGALHVLYQGLYTKYIGGVDTSIGKTKRIIVLTPIKLLDGAKASLPNTIENNANALFEWDEWIDAIKEVAAFYSFPVLDFYNLSGVNPHLNRTVVGTEPGYTGNYNPYVTDGTHPTQEMHEYMSDVLVGFIKTLGIMNL